MSSRAASERSVEAPNVHKFAIVVDTREQMPWRFSEGTPTVRAGLKSGDYSYAGGETRVAIERKSLADLVGSLTAGRERFWRELERLESFDFSAVIVEGELLDVMTGRLISKASPSSILGSVVAIMVDRGIPVLFASSRECAANLAERILRRLHARHLRELEGSTSCANDDGATPPGAA